MLALKPPDIPINGELSSGCVSTDFFSGSDYITSQYFYQQSWKHPVPKYHHMGNCEGEENEL